MTLAKAFITVSCSTVACAVVGAALGWCIGTLAPDAYRGWFAPDAPRDLSTAEFGLGLGLGQGLVAGMLVGVAIVAIVAWHDVASRRRDDA